MKIRVLLVDDEKDFVEPLSERLNARGLVVSTAGSGAEALECLRDREFDVLVLDLVMPGMDGLTALREIKNVKPLVEVIMLSGNATVQTAIEGLKQGAFDFLLKPVELTDLMEKLALAFKRKTDQETRIRNAEVQRILLTRNWG